MRLFAAVVPPPECLDELGRVVDRLHGLPGADGLRWTSRPGWHLTLAFMGEVGEELLPELRVRLGRAAHRTPAFPLRLHGGGHFGRRALWTGVAGDLDTLRLLAERSDAAARRAGVAMDEHRRYQAHLTVGRGRGGGGAAPALPGRARRIRGHALAGDRAGARPVEPAGERGAGRAAPVRDGRRLAP